MDKERLNDYRWLLKNIEDLEQEIESFRESIMLKSQVLSSDPKAPCKSPDRFSDVVSAIIDTENKLFKNLKKLMTERSAIEQAIEQLPEVEKRLIRQRYIDGKAWEQICVNMGYGWAQIHRMHSKALVNIKKHDTQ